MRSPPKANVDAATIATARPTAIRSQATMVGWGAPYCDNPSPVPPDEAQARKSRDHPRQSNSQDSNREKAVGDAGRRRLLRTGVDEFRTHHARSSVRVHRRSLCLRRSQ